MSICVCGGTLKKCQSLSAKVNRRLEFEKCGVCGRTMFEKLYTYMGGRALAAGSQARKEYFTAIEPKPKAVVTTEQAAEGAEQ